MKRSRIQLSDEFDGDGAALFKACAEQGLEGIVSKHSLAPYRSGRSKTWLKTKCWTDLDRQKLRLTHRLTGSLSRLPPLSCQRARLRRRGILQRHHFGHGAGLELNELINHC